MDLTYRVSIGIFLRKHFAQFFLQESQLHMLKFETFALKAPSQKVSALSVFRKFGSDVNLTFFLQILLAPGLHDSEDGPLAKRSSFKLVFKSFCFLN